MKERPILFSTPMVQAILAGNKLQTRRVVKPQPKVCDGEVVYEVAKGDWWVGTNHGHFHGHSSTRFKCRYGKVGDVLWVRETFKKSDYTLNGYTYKANAHPQMPKKGWKPNIHMPKEACRIKLRITNIRVERLQDITYADAIAEGIHQYEEGDYKNYGFNEKNYDDWGLLNPKDSFQTLWQSINSEQSWNDNPFVWVIEFERI